jgi:hypothetical protein
MPVPVALPWQVFDRCCQAVARAPVVLHPSSNARQEKTRETVEFDTLSSVPDFSILPVDEANKETVDEKLVIELLGQLLLAASRSHRTFLEQQELQVRQLIERIPENPRQVESELARVYQEIRASFSRLVEAIGDHPSGMV